MHGIPPNQNLEPIGLLQLNNKLSKFGYWTRSSLGEAMKNHLSMQLWVSFSVNFAINKDDFHRLWL
jgi:hypothetical protein